VEQLYHNSEQCYIAFQGIATIDSFQPCFSVVEAIHQRPWILSEFPYPVIFALLKAATFHGVCGGLTKLFTLDL